MKLKKTQNQKKKLLIIENHLRQKLKKEKEENQKRRVRLVDLKPIKWMMMKINKQKK